MMSVLDVKNEVHTKEVTFPIHPESDQWNRVFWASVQGSWKLDDTNPSAFHKAAEVLW